MPSLHTSLARLGSHQKQEHQVPVVGKLREHWIHLHFRGFQALRVWHKWDCLAFSLLGKLDAHENAQKSFWWTPWKNLSHGCWLCLWVGPKFPSFLSETSFWHGASSYQWMLACVWLVRRDFDAVGQSLRHLRRHLRHLGHCVPKQPSSRIGFLPVQIHTNLGGTHSMERLTKKCTITMTLTMIFPNGWSSVTTWSTWTNRECMLKCSIRTPATWGLNGRPGAWYGWMLEGAWLREQSTSNSTHCSRRDIMIESNIRIAV